MGLMQNIVVVKYVSEWREKFAAEARRLSDTLTSALIAIHHIGSTSVPGLAAKPIIDILAVVRSLNELDACKDAIMALGYEPKGEFGIVGRRLFAKGSDAYRTHHVYAYEPGHLEIGVHLDLRDYLRAHPNHAHRYAELKAQLAERHRNDIEAFCRKGATRQGANQERASMARGRSMTAHNKGMQATAASVRCARAYAAPDA